MAQDIINKGKIVESWKKSSKMHKNRVYKKTNMFIIDMVFVICD